MLKGRPLKVLKALDKKSAHDKELEKAKNNEVNDHRNLYLAKVCLLLCNFLWSRLLKLIDMHKINILIQLNCNRRDLLLRELQLLKAFQPVIC